MVSFFLIGWRCVLQRAVVIGTWSFHQLDCHERIFLIGSVATQSRSMKFCISMWRVRRVGICVFAIAIAAVLSSYSVVAESCGIPRLSSIDQRYRVIFPASAATMNSASVEIWDMVGWNLDHYTTGALAKQRHKPDMDLLCFVSPAQWESTYLWEWVGSESGIVTSCVSCGTVGKVTVGRFGCNSWCQ